MNQNISNKRILRDILEIQKNPLDEDGIYIHVDEDNIKKIKACILGPTNTPYEYGFYLFDISFPNDYPFKPPIVKFQTRRDNIRFNPNLYAEGKVCISILNTWSGPQWTSCLTLRSVLLSLQTILHENPLHNEPGYENDYTITNQNYNNVIKYQNINTAIYYISNQIINYSFYGFEVFKEIIIKQFLNNYKHIIKQLEYFKNKNDEIIQSIYSMKYLIKYDELKNNLENLYNQLYINIKDEIKQDTIIIDDIKDDINVNTNDINVNTNDNIKEVNKIKRKAPNQKANLFEINYETISENDNQMYIVYEDKKGIKRWKKSKK